LKLQHRNDSTLESEIDEKMVYIIIVFPLVQSGFVLKNHIANHVLLYKTL